MSAQLEKIIETLQGMQHDYEEIEGSPLPATLKAAVDERWEVASAAIEIAGLTAYPPHEQEADSRRAIALSVALRLIRELEERLILETIIKPTALAETAFWSNTLGIWKTFYSIAGDIWNTLKNIFEVRNALPTLLGLFTIRILKSVNVIALPELAKAFSRGIKIKNEQTKKLRDLALPQRQAKRYRVVRKSRK